MTLGDLEGSLAVVGLTLKNVAIGAVASFVALRFFDGLGAREKWVTFIGGWAMAAWGGPPLTAYLELKASIEVGVVLVLGLFGMAIAAELIKLVRDTDWRGLFTALVNTLLRRGGGGSGGQQ